MTITVKNGFFQCDIVHFFGAVHTEDPHSLLFLSGTQLILRDGELEKYISLLKGRLLSLCFILKYLIDIPPDPQKLSLEADPLFKWGVRLQNSSTINLKLGVRLQGQFLWIQRYIFFLYFLSMMDQIKSQSSRNYVVMCTVIQFHITIVLCSVLCHFISTVLLFLPVPSVITTKIGRSLLFYWVITSLSCFVLSLADPLSSPFPYVSVSPN